MNEEITIAPAKPEDARGILDVLYRTWLATYPNERFGITKEQIEESFKDSLSEEGVMKLQNKITNIPKDDMRLVATSGTRIVGIARLTKNNKVNKIETLYVLPEYQGKGIGKMLWQEMKKFYDPNKDIVVHAVIYNQDAIEFYKKLGFVDTGKRFADEAWRLQQVGLNIPEMEMVIKSENSKLS